MTHPKNAEYQRKWWLANRERHIEQMKVRDADRRGGLREKFRELKATLKCSRCPEDHPATLDFHHRDPAAKEVLISQAISKGWAWEKILAEIDKCEVLCANCHRKEHAGVA